MYTYVDVNRQLTMVCKNDLLNEDHFQSIYTDQIDDENHVLLNNKQYELDQHQNYTKKDHFHWMENENDEPSEQHIHHQNPNHNYPWNKNKKNNFIIIKAFKIVEKIILISSKLTIKSYFEIDCFKTTK